jgi:hypothetical protein
VAALIVAGALFAVLRGDSGPRPAGDGARAAAAPVRRLAVDQTYMGVACRTPNSIACDRVGVAVWLPRPAQSLTATVSGRTVRLQVAPGTRFYQGFIHPAGLLTGAERIRPDRGLSFWESRNPATRTLRLLAHYRDRPDAAIVLRVPLSPGWG